MSETSRPYPSQISEQEVDYNKVQNAKVPYIAEGASREMTCSEIIESEIKRLHGRINQLETIRKMLPLEPTYEQHSAIRNVLLTSIK